LLEAKLWRRSKTGSFYRPPPVGWGGAGAHHVEAVEGGFGRFFALLQSFGRSFHAGRAWMPDVGQTSTQQISDQSALI
jgi:hypothetical protein